MVPSKRLEPVRRVAKSREDSAARDLGASQRRMHEQEAKLDDLRHYHREYLQRFSEAAKNGISASQLQEYRAFMSKLETAIELQQKAVDESHLECSSRKGVWQEKRVRTQALGKVVDRLHSAERKAHEKQEQKESDEHGQRDKTRG